MMPALNTIAVECPWCPQIVRTMGALVRHKQAKHAARMVIPVPVEPVVPTIAPRATTDWSRALCVRCRTPRKNRRYCAHCLIALFAAPRMEKQAA